MAETIRVEVAYARPGQLVRIPLQLSAGATIAEAIERSGIRHQCPEIDLTVNRVGIFARLCNLDDQVQEGDRVEIYRPLQVDPKEARRRRAASRNQFRGGSG